MGPSLETVPGTMKRFYGASGECYFVFEPKLPPKVLEEAKDYCVSAQPLPTSFRVAIDYEKSCLICHGPTLCFAVTGNSILRGNYRQEFVPALNGLMDAESVGSYASPL